MTQAQEAQGRFVFLDYLRALAAWMVVWDHFANEQLHGQGRAFVPAEFVHKTVAAPLGLIQDFGWLGVALFFLISGFIISDRARVESAGTFVVRRVLRIYPMLAIAVVLATVMAGGPAAVTPSAFLLNLTLANYLIVPQVVLVGVAWTLAIEMVFYALTAMTQVARNSPHRIAFNLAVAALTIWKARDFGPNFFLLAIAVSYLPVLIMGQIIYWWLSRRQLPAVMALAYLATAYGVFYWGLSTLQPGFLPVTNSYLISVTYAALLFLALLRAPLPQSRVIRFLSDTSYSVYLLHGIVGVPLLVALIRHAPLSVSILAAIAVSLAAATITFRFVELPFQGLGRRLTRKPLAPAPADKPS